MSATTPDDVRRSLCPKNRSDAEARLGQAWPRWVGPIVGLLSLIWFLVRVVPKPSRAAYPCQRVAAPLAASFVLWIGGMCAAVTGFRCVKRAIRRSRLPVVLIYLACAAAVAAGLLVTLPGRPALADHPVPNAPIGGAKGLHPGRVVWAHDPNATDWLGPGNGRWWESDHTHQVAVDSMMFGAVRALTGKRDDGESWRALFTHFNKARGKGQVGYRPGEKIAIKVNLVGCIDSDWGGVDRSSYNLTGKADYMNTAPQVMVSLLGQLVRAAGVRQTDISIGDPLSRFPNEYYDICRREFPDVHYLDHAGGNAQHPRTPVQPSGIPFYWSCRPQGKIQDYVPDAYADATYFIGVANLKSHTLAGVTLTGKNYYGFLRRIPREAGYFDMHASLPKSSPGEGKYRALVDLMGHAHTGGKGLVYFIDGLYAGVHPIEEWPRRWNSAPFNGDWTSSLFASEDPVALDSVAFDFLRSEWSDYPHMSGADDYLHEAALADNPPSGTFYDPDHPTSTVRLRSLGVHEHWNSASSKQYSRNLGAGRGIELVRIGAGGY